MLDALRSGETTAQKSSPTRDEQNLEAGDKVRTVHALHTYITYSTYKLKGVFLNDEYTHIHELVYRYREYAVYT